MSGLTELSRNRSFVLLWFGQTFGVLADWALRAFVFIWVFRLTGSGVAVSLVGVAAIAPMLAVGPIAGVFVDRWHRAHTMSGAMLVRGVLVLLLLSVHGRFEVPIIFAVVLLFNCASQFLGPAVAAATPAVIREEHLGRANGLLSLVNGVGAVCGPALGSLLLLRVGASSTILLITAVYALAASLLAGVRAGKPVRDAALSGTQSDLLAGIRYLLRSPLLVFLNSVAFVALLGLGALSVLDVVFVVRALQLRAEMVGVLLTSNGVGMVVGSLTVAALSGKRSTDYRWLLGLSLAGNGLSLAAYALAPSLAVSAAALGVSGACFIVSLASFMTLIQMESDDAYMGRIMSLMYIPMAVAIILSMSCGGMLADLLGIRQVIGGDAALVLCASILSLMVVPRSMPRSALASRPAGP